MHVPLAEHMPLSQSKPAPHFFPVSHGKHASPPQSTSLSIPFKMQSAQWGFKLQSSQQLTMRHSYAACAIGPNHTTPFALQHGPRSNMHDRKL